MFESKFLPREMTSAHGNSFPILQKVFATTAIGSFAILLASTPAISQSIDRVLTYTGTVTTTVDSQTFNRKVVITISPPAQFGNVTESNPFNLSVFPTTVLATSFSQPGAITVFSAAKGCFTTNSYAIISFGINGSASCAANYSTTGSSSTGSSSNISSSLSLLQWWSYTTQQSKPTNPISFRGVFQNPLGAKAVSPNQINVPFSPVPNSFAIPTAIGAESSVNGELSPDLTQINLQISGNTIDRSHPFSSKITATLSK
jgi:hypothetical protein